MPSKIVCFWLEPTDLVQESLRRYRSVHGDGAGCPLPYEGFPGSLAHGEGTGIHNAEVVTVAMRPRSEEDTTRMARGSEKNDPRWPTHCRCGAAFADDDQWQFNVTSLYRRADTGELHTLHVGATGAPAGAMWDARWYDDHHRGNHKPGDGYFVVLRTPAGDWMVDGRSSNGTGAGWLRTGVVPKISASPSIAIGAPVRMHGWLRDGVLELDQP